MYHMKKILIIAFLTLPFFKIFAFDIGLSEYGVNYQVSQIDKKIQKEMEVDNIGHALGIYFNYTPYKYTDLLYKNWQSTLGADFIYIKDNSPFSQSVTEKNKNSTSTKSSKVMGYSIYLETGFSFNIKRFNSISLGLMVGYKYHDINRTIFKCADCYEQDLSEFSHSIYLKPFVTFKVLSSLNGKLYFFYDFQESGFSNGLGLQVRF